MASITLLFTILYFVLASHSACVLSEEVDTPTWPTDCTFTKYPRTQIENTEHMEIVRRISSEEACESKCRDNPKCGMYSWRIENYCLLYQHSVKLWTKAGLNIDDYLKSKFRVNEDYFSGSRECEAHYASQDCTSYPKRIKNKRHNRIKFYHVSSRSEDAPLTPAKCQSLCNLFSKCRSVEYILRTDDLTQCNLFLDTLAGEKGRRCRPDLNTSCFTYDRKCGDEPYFPDIQ